MNERFLHKIKVRQQIQEGCFLTHSRCVWSNVQFFFSVEELVYSSFMLLDE